MAETATIQRTRIQMPPMYKVILSGKPEDKNSVVHLISEVFAHAEGNAKVMVEAMEATGKTIAGVYSKEIASTRSTAFTFASQQRGLNVKATIEPTE